MLQVMYHKEVRSCGHADLAGHRGGYLLESRVPPRVPLALEGIVAKKGRRTRSPHPGVVLLKRKWASGRLTWRARFVDQDTGKARYVTLNALGLTNEQARRDWAIR